MNSLPKKQMQYARMCKRQTWIRTPVLMYHFYDNDQHLCTSWMTTLLWALHILFEKTMEKSLIFLLQNIFCFTNNIHVYAIDVTMRFNIHPKKSVEVPKCVVSKAQPRYMTKNHNHYLKRKGLPSSYYCVNEKSQK